MLYIILGAVVFGAVYTIIKYTNRQEDPMDLVEMYGTKPLNAEDYVIFNQYKSK